MECANASSSSSSSHANGISWPKSLPDPSFIEGFFLNEQENGLIEDAKTVQENKKESWKKETESNSTKNYLVKDQWTDDEDRYYTCPKKKKHEFSLLLPEVHFIFILRIK